MEYAFLFNRNKTFYVENNRMLTPSTKNDEEICHNNIVLKSFKMPLLFPLFDVYLLRASYVSTTT